MPKVIIEVPEGFEEVVKELEQTLKRAQKGVEGPRAGTWRRSIRIRPVSDVLEGIEDGRVPCSAAIASSRRARER
jgi:hypothetical protein